MVLAAEADADAVPEIVEGEASVVVDMVVSKEVSMTAASYS